MVTLDRGPTGSDDAERVCRNLFGLPLTRARAKALFDMPPLSSLRTVSVFFLLLRFFSANLSLTRQEQQSDDDDDNIATMSHMADAAAPPGGWSQERQEGRS